MDKYIITLEGKDLAWLEQIIIDKDKEEAFNFLKELIYDKYKRQEQGHCKPQI